MGWFLFIHLYIYMFLYVFIYFFIYLFILYHWISFIIGMTVRPREEPKTLTLIGWSRTAPAKFWKTTVGLGRENTLGCNAVPVSTPKFLVIACITCNHLPTFMNLHQNAQRGFHLCMLSDSINVNVHYPKALWPSGKYPSIIYKLVSDLAWYIEQQSHFWAPNLFPPPFFSPANPDVQLWGKPT